MEIAPALKPRTASASIKAKEDYTKYSWFAEKFTRRQAEEAMADRPDGTYLIRPSSSHTGFSLSVRYTEPRHVVILESQGKFGFSEPTTFHTLLELIQYFQRESLACYNAELETKLVYPYKDAPIVKDGPADEMDEAEEENLYMSKREALRVARQQREDGGKQKIAQYGEIYDQIREDRVKHKAQSMIVMLLKEQRQIHESIQVGGPDQVAIKENLSHLKARQMDAERSLELLDNRLQTAAAENEKAKGTSLPSGAASGTPGKGRSGCGYREDIDRPAAEQMLDGKPDGHYVIRRSKNRTTDPYTLSMRFDGKTKHIQIKFDGTRYGLAEPLAFYSIPDLCEYYTTTPLSNTITKCLSVAVNLIT